MLGGSAMTFGALFRTVATAAGAPPGAELTAAQRLRLVEAATAERLPRLGPLRRSAARPGFAAACERLLGELQAAGIEPEAVEASAATLEGSAYLADVATLYSAYAAARDRLGRIDSHAIARAAIAALRQRPLVLAAAGLPLRARRPDPEPVRPRRRPRRGDRGDDRGPLRGRQPGARGARGADRAAARGGAGADRGGVQAGPGQHRVAPALRARPRLRPARRARHRARPQPHPAALGRRPRRGRGDRRRGLAAARTPAPTRPRSPSPSATPAAAAARSQAALEANGIATALEAELPVAGTAVGGALVALLEAEFGGRRAADLLRYLRGPSGFQPDSVDWLERRLRRGRVESAEEALALFHGTDGEPPHDLQRLREAAARSPAELAAAVGRLAATMASRPLRGDGDGPRLGPGDGLELRAAGAIAARSPSWPSWGRWRRGRRSWRRPSPPSASAPGRGRSRDGCGSPAPTGCAPAASTTSSSARCRTASSRAATAAPTRSSPRASASRSASIRAATAKPRSATCSRPAWRCRAAASTSPTATATRTAPPKRARPTSTACGRCWRRRPTGPSRTRSRRRSRSGATWRGWSSRSPRRPPSDALARALAAHGPSADAADLLAAVGVGGELAARLERRLDAARRAEAAARAPGPLTNPAVLDSLAAVAAYGGTTLEEFDLCSYRWFANHELDPQPLGAAPDPLVQGGLMHAVLDRLYRERPGGDPLPRPGSLAAWIGRGRGVLAAVVAERELGDHPAERAMGGGSSACSNASSPRRPSARPAASSRGCSRPLSGSARGRAERPTLDLGGWGLHGAIDRVDRGRRRPRRRPRLQAGRQASRRGTSSRSGRSFSCRSTCSPAQIHWGADTGRRHLPPR